MARRAHVLKFSRGQEGARFLVFTWPGGCTFLSFHVAGRVHVLEFFTWPEGRTFFKVFTWPEGRTFLSFHVAGRAHVLSGRTEKKIY